MPRGLSCEMIRGPEPLDPRFPADAQFDLVVEGSSLDKMARDGDLIRCVDVEKAGLEISHGDVVVIERRRGEEVLLLGKRALRQGEELELWSESTRDYWREPVIRHKPCAEPGVDVRIVGKVLFVYRK